MSRRVHAGIGRCRQAGLGLLEAALIVLLIAGVLTIGILNLRSLAPAQAARADSAALAVADQALAGFAAANGRLPCPSPTPGGVEACESGAQKGWLPAATLRADGSGGAPGELILRYVVYRGGSDRDLAAAPMPNLFNPTGANGPYAFDAINELDLCQALENALNAAPSSANAHIEGATAGAAINVAYGIAAPGERDADGDGSPFDGANAGAAPRLERPDVATAAAYDDRVRVRDFATLSVALNCVNVMASLDGLARAAGVIAEVASQKSALQTSAIIATTVAGVKALIQIALAIKAGVAIGTASATLAAAASALAGAIASCVVLVGCALIPPYTAAVALAGVAIGLAAAATVAYAAAAVALGVAFGLALDAAIRAGADTDDIGVPDWGPYVESICGVVPNLQQQANASQAAYQQALDAENAAQQAQQAAWNQLLAVAHDSDPDGGNDARLIAARTAANARHQAVQNSTERQADVIRATRRLSDLQEALADVQGQLANETDPDARDTLEQTIVNLQQQIVTAQAELQNAQTAAAAAAQQAQQAEQALQQAVQAAVNAYPEDDRDAVSGALQDFLDAYETWYGRSVVRAQRQAERDEAAAALAEGQNACAAAQALVGGGGDPTGVQIGVWSGAEDVLRAADRKGAVR